MNLEKKTKKIKKEIDKMMIKYESGLLGIYISLFSHEFIKRHVITKEEFLKSLEHSLDMLEEEEK